jgi:hypothetical protein
MVRLTTCSLAFGVALALASTAASADTVKGSTASLPKVGAMLGEHGAPSWPKLHWLYEAPSPTDAAGKIVIHWFCASRVQACTDDLARIVTLRDSGHAYVIAYIAGSGRDAKRLDPIRESEGIGRGTVAYGAGVTRLMKQLGVGRGPASIVVGVDGKVAMVSVGGDPATLDARDAKVDELAGAIKEYTTRHDGPTTAKPGQTFSLSLQVLLASWLHYIRSAPADFELSAPKDIKCNATKLGRAQLEFRGQTLTATLRCSAPRGVYEARGHIRFGYDTPTGAHGMGDDATTWKFSITP